VLTQELELAASQQRSPGGSTPPASEAVIAARGPPIITQLQRQLAAAQAELARLRVQVEVRCPADWPSTLLILGHTPQRTLLLSSCSTAL